MSKKHTLWIVAGLFIIGIGAYSKVSNLNRPPIKSNNSVNSDVIGKYAYDKATGVYKGKITGQKLCKDQTQLQCYEIQGELGVHEILRNDIVVKNNLR